MIVVAEGPTAAGKSTWCVNHFPAVTVGEIHLPRELEESMQPTELDARRVANNCLRWERALVEERKHGIAVCDTDPFKLHYSWCLWRLGRITREDWENAAATTRTAFADEKLGLADLILVEFPSKDELQRRREGDRTATGRRRRRFDLHSQFGTPLREWYEAVARIEPSRVRWRLPDNGTLDPRPTRRDPRSGVDLFDALLAELPT